MNTDSGRELIIQNIITALSAIPCISTIERRHPATIEEIKAIAPVQMPFIGVLGGLPSPVEYIGRLRNQNNITITSELDVVLRFIAIQKEAPDEWVSHYLNILLGAIMGDNNRGGLALKTDIAPEYIYEILTPYIGFEITAKVTYQHTNGI